ncbi:MAG: putative lipid II flippase FtsW [Alcanivoracaceae bacterium]|jgi:cell division protein FtsW|nr:putative lipid II flippase FtsW [Alcanivoracaceae bacterium]
MVLDRFALFDAPRDQLLLVAVGCLALMGLVMVTSASLQIAETRLGSPFYYALRHGFFLGMAVMAGATVYLFVPFSLLEKLRYPALFASLVVLALVLMPGIGREVNGSQRWISLAGFNVQPSELAKLGFIVYLAGYINERQQELREQWQGFLRPLGLLSVLVLLLLMEPDFGAVVVLGVAVMGMLFLGGVPTLRFLLVGLAAVMLAALVAVAQPYRVARLMSFLDPWADQFGGGYQLTQSLIAFGRGHWTGAGLGNSVQKLFYLPEAHTDFVFAVSAEELGLLGSMIMVSLFALVCWRIFRSAIAMLEAGDLFRGQVVLGIGLVLAGQAFINMGVNMGLLPTKGLTLPFVSYGGSSLVVCAVMLGLVLRAQREFEPASPRRRPAGTARRRRP